MTTGAVPWFSMSIRYLREVLIQVRPDNTYSMSVPLPTLSYPRTSLTWSFVSRSYSATMIFSFSPVVCAVTTTLTVSA